MRSDRPITCRNATTKEDTYQLRFACDGYFPGTSGSPWLADYDPNTRTGRIVGVIGGREEGGAEDNVSYSSYFDEDVKHLYDEAVRESAPQ
jgi:V8-like Glu-specific endopeptidase